MRNGFRFSLIGEEISYSQSPAIFAAIFRLAHVAGEFDLISIKSSELQSTLRQLVLDGNRGLSVTIPHKREIVQFLDDVDPISHRVSAVNCVLVNEQQLLGFNTDCHGFAYPLHRLMPKQTGETVLIVGTGGAARAVAHSLYTEFGFRKISICSRTEEGFQKCAAHLRAHYDKLAVSEVLSTDLVPMSKNTYDIVVNCTPLGGFWLPNDSPFGTDFPCKAGGIFYDLNYNRPNRLVQTAIEKGMVTIDGSLMLVAQAVKAFQIWTDIEVPVEPIYQEVFGKR